MASSTIRETQLYAPIKALLEGQGYEVKSEIGATDVVAIRDSEEPVIIELKTSFSLALFHQGIERQNISDSIYIAVPHGTGRAFQKSFKSNLSLCRRLGLGLMTVRLKDGVVAIHVDPGPYSPRKSKEKKRRLLKEFAERVGDPNTGGATRKGLVTAYRQNALGCAVVLHKEGATKAAEVARVSGVENATRLMSDNHYGWFDRVRIGIYALSPKGREAIVEYSSEIEKISAKT